MAARERPFAGKGIFEALISQINWDWLFLKGRIIFTVIFVLGVLAFLLWFLQ